jgi:hypothetical protein
MKPVVMYSRLLFCEIGVSAAVVPINHGNTVMGQGAVNGEVRDTSRVVAYDEATGWFETLHTLYCPAQFNVAHSFNV